MLDTLKLLFRGEEPSVHKFREKLRVVSKEEQAYYYQLALKTAFCEWNLAGENYPVFLHSLIQHDWKKALGFMLTKTVLGSLRYSLQEEELLMKLIALLEGKKRGFMPSYDHLAFQNRYKLSPLGDKLRTYRLNTDEMMDI